MAFECDDEVKENIGVTNCKDLPEYPKLIITTPKGFRFTEAEAISATFWQDAIVAGRVNRVYLWPEIFMATPQDVETSYQVTPSAKRKVLNGRKSYKFNFTEGICLHRAMWTHSGTGQRVIIVDYQNNGLITKTGTDEFAGLLIDLLNVENVVSGDGSGTVSTTPVDLTLKDSLELNLYGYMAPMSFVNSLERLTDVTVAIVGTPSASSITFTVKSTCDKVHISGLVAADFSLLNGSGVAQTIAARTENDEAETYTITGTSWVDGTLNLVSPALLSITAYESTGAATVNIP